MPGFPALRTIEERISVRSYRSAKPQEAVLGELESFINNLEAGPFGSKPRFKLFNLSLAEQKELRQFGTYGFIKGANYFILGCTNEKAGAPEDLGYLLEKIILKATSLKLGTCWMGGTFNRASFARQAGLQPGELLLAVCPLGLPQEEISRLSRAERLAMKTKRRKPWGELFFASDFKRPLTKEEAGAYADSLEAVRLAPSALNNQPWRIIKDSAGCYHLYLQRKIFFNRVLFLDRLERMDVGICMCHFALVAEEQNLDGRWVVLAQGPQAFAGRQYIATWQP